jgi:hypothetical protein
MHRRSLWLGFSRDTRVTRSFPPGKESFVKNSKRKHSEFFWILHRAAHLFIDEMPRENRSAMNKRMLRRWRHYGGDMPASYASSYASRRRIDTMGKELRRVARDIGEVKINEKYTCFFMTLNWFMGLALRDLREQDVVAV